VDEKKITRPLKGRKTPDIEFVASAGAERNDSILAQLEVGRNIADAVQNRGQIASQLEYGYERHHSIKREAIL
jgi:hypothetical protein